MRRIVARGATSSSPVLAVAAVGMAAMAFAFASLQQDFAAYWIAGKARGSASIRT